MRRHPAVAGRFYPGNAEALRQQVQGFIEPGAEKVNALGILSPHAGLVYSGGVAGAVYSRVVLPDIFILIGPNHTGLGPAISIMAEGEWETPLGAVRVETGLARSILSRSSRFQEDTLAHLHEHSLEVQLPFIQVQKDDSAIVPIQMLDTRLATCIELGQAIGEAVKAGAKDKGRRTRDEKSNNVLIVASSDMTHYESADVAREKDFKAIRHILDLDPEGLYRTVKEHSITMCGYGPAVAMLSACKILGAGKADLIRYSTSGDVSGDFGQVVGYAGIVVR